MSKHNKPTLGLPKAPPPPPPPAVPAIPEVDMTPAPLRGEDLEPGDPGYEEFQAGLIAAAEAVKADTALKLAKAEAARREAQAGGIPERFADLLEKNPLPWVVGPYGDIWVAADVECYDPEQESGYSKIPGLNGTFWRATIERDPSHCKPRHVMENPGETAHPMATTFMTWLTELLSAKRL